MSVRAQGLWEGLLSELRSLLPKEQMEQIEQRRIWPLREEMADLEALLDEAEQHALECTCRRERRA